MHIFSQIHHFLKKAEKNVIFCVIFSIFVFFIGVFLITSLPGAVQAGIFPEGWDHVFKKPVSEGVLVNVPEGNAVDKIKILVWHNIVPMVKYILAGLSILMFTVYLLKMIVSSGEEEDISSAKTGMLWAVLGFLVIAIASDLAEAFDPWVNASSGDIVVKSRIEDTTYRVVSYGQLLAGVIAVFYIFFAGFRMITSHGEEETLSTQKAHLKWGFVGLILIMLADPMINVVFYPYDGEKGLGAKEVQKFLSEGTATLKFFLSFVGIAAVISLVASGVMYILSAGDDGATTKAKKNIIMSLIAIVIIISSYILVIALVPGGG
ncbi:hypothetical protein HZA38_04900 [Candidatus Peregrinibacteria bacterium]|nr:hypothetical protein [Candidatus Peregrinibacteria bacterium]